MEVEPPTTPPPTVWTVNKFGGACFVAKARGPGSANQRAMGPTGTSVASAECYREAAAIVTDIVDGDPYQRVAVVVSAMGGKPKVTDMLLQSVHAAAEGDMDRCDALLEVVREKYSVCIRELLGGSGRDATLLATIEADIRDLKDILRAVRLMRFDGEQMLELVSGYGEIWSAGVFSQLLTQSGYDFAFVNAKDVLFVKDVGRGGPEVIWDKSRSALQAAVKQLEADGREPHLVITGYVASTEAGVATTLKRDGSDYSASIFAYLLKARDVYIWTDVSGVLTADPRRVPGARPLQSISYNEAMELAFFGAKVIHPKTMQPAIYDNIPIYIKNTFSPASPGTRIHLSNVDTVERDTCVCGFSTIDAMALVNLEGPGMVGIPGVAQRLFGALQNKGISVTLIAQASSEHSITVAIQASMSEAAAEAITAAFIAEIQAEAINPITSVQPCSIIAAVGDGMSSTPGISGRFFDALGRANINIVAISQGCSGRNVSAVVMEKDSAKALRAVHGAFMLSANTISVGVVGSGPIGRAIVHMIKTRNAALERRYNCKLGLRAWCNSAKMILAADEEKIFEWHCEETGEGPDADLDAFTDHLRVDHGPYSVIVDCSTSADVARRHATWLSSGIHVVTANKHSLGGSMALYEQIMAQKAVSNYYYETCVGASLPVLGMIKQLQNSGDPIRMMRGTLSASLSWIMLRVNPSPLGQGGEDIGCSLVDAALEAEAKGLTERDFSEDFSGHEVAMKLIILAREMGMEVDVEHVDVVPLVPGILPDTPREEALEKMREHEGAFREQVAAAAANGAVLRYVASMRKGALTVALEEVPVHHTFALLECGGYAVEYHTDYHKDHPLSVNGALGDDAAVAGGLLADLVQVVVSLGAFDRGSVELLARLSTKMKRAPSRIPSYNPPLAGNSPQPFSSGGSFADFAALLRDAPPS